MAELFNALAYYQSVVGDHQFFRSDCTVANPPEAIGQPKSAKYVYGKIYLYGRMTGVASMREDSLHAHLNGQRKREVYKLLLLYFSEVGTGIVYLLCTKNAPLSFYR